MEPQIRSIQEKKLIGKRLTMTIANDPTFQLWCSLMPHRNEISNRTSSDLINMKIYSAPPDFSSFTPDTEFEKWAVAEVSDFEHVPQAMETFTMPAGLYAVFLHKGPASTFTQTLKYIFMTWLPGSGYLLDHRPHFEILRENYKHDDPVSEEEVWIPVKKKA